MMNAVLKALAAAGLAALMGIACVDMGSLSISKGVIILATASFP